jgi:hypothetical protein
MNPSKIKNCENILSSIICENHKEKTKIEIKDTNTGYQLNYNPCCDSFAEIIENKFYDLIAEDNADNFMLDLM